MTNLDHHLGMSEIRGTGSDVAADPLALSESALQCPVCRSIDWFRNCNVIVRNETTGEIVHRCVLPWDPRLETAPWACMSCAYEVPRASPLDIRLSAPVASR